MKSRSQTFSFLISLSLHLAIILLLVLSFEQTIVIPANLAQPNEQKEIIDAVMINKESLQAEVKRLEAKEARKRQQEEARQKELLRKENEARMKRQEEEKLALELKKKNEQLKKEAELQQLAQQKQEKERQVRIKHEQEELKKLKKEKEAALAEKKKAEAERKALEKQKELIKQKEQAELAKNTQSQAEETRLAASSNIKVNPDQIMQHALLIRNKIQQNWRQPIGMDFSKFKCKIAIRMLPTGEVVEARVTGSSGNMEFDRSAELAVHKASPLPIPSDANLADKFRSFDFTFNPGGAA